jgi:hypothetical protein
MKLATLVLVLLGLLVGPALSVPVDPNAEDGVAAFFAYEDDVNRQRLWVLRTNGDCWRYDIEAGWVNMVEMVPPVQMAEVEDWYPFYLRSSDGTIWKFYDHAWQVLGTPPWTPIQSSPQSLGGVKEMFRGADR